MLADWYFCNAVRLTAAASHAYLDTLAILHSTADEEAVSCAVDHLRGAELSQLLYATPALLHAHRSLAGRGRGAARLMARLEAVLDEAADRTEHGLRLTDLLGEAQTRPGPELLDRLGQAARRDHQTTTRPYLDTADAAPEITVLAGLEELCLDDPSTVSAALAHADLAGVLDRALRGTHGRMAVLIACRILTPHHSHRVQAALLSASPGVCWLEPDLLDVAANAWFSDPDSAAVEMRELDVLTRLLGAHPEPDGRQLHEVRSMLGSTAGTPDRLAEAFWHATLAGFIARADPSGAGARLGPWLDPQESPDAAGPWLHRKDGQWRPLVPKDPAKVASASRFTGIRQPTSLLRTLGWALAAATIAGGGRCEDQVLEFVVHVVDVLVDVQHRELLRSLASGETFPTDASLPLPVAALAVHVRGVLDRIGKGQVLAVEPDRIVDLLVNRGERADEGEIVGEPARLHENAATFVVLDWIKETVSGRTGLPGADPAARWFDVEARDGARVVPPAQRMLNWAVTRLQRRAQDGARAGAAGQVSGPLLLLRQLWPEASRERAQPGWPARLDDGSSGPIGAEEFLLADALGEQTWATLSNRAEARVRRGDARLALYGERLAATFPGPSGRFDVWFDAWAALVDALNAPREFRRELRRRMVSFLALEVSAPGDENRLSLVAEKVIDAIVEFGTAADIWNLAKALGTTEDDAPRCGVRGERLARLRARFLGLATVSDETMARSRHSAGPSQVRSDRQALRLRVGTVRNFLYWHGDADVLGADPYGARLDSLYRTLWEDDQRTVGPPFATVPLDETPPDERWVLGTVVDHGRARTHLRLADLRPPAELDGVFDPAAMPPADRHAWLGDLTGSVAVVGVIAALQDARRRTEAVTLVHVGASEPVAVAGRFADGAVGDPVRVTLCRTSPDTALTGSDLASLPSAAPRHEEVRTAVVRARPGRPGAGQELEVEVAGVGLLRSTANGSVLDRGQLVRRTLRWDPDTSAAFRDGDEIMTLARWDADDCDWYPVDRTATELTAALRADGPGTTRWVTVVGVDAGEEGDLWRVATEPGHCFVVPGELWADQNRLEALREDEAPDGLRLSVGVLSGADNGPRLVLVGAEPVDERNRRWAGLDRASLSADWSSVEFAWRLVADVDDGFEPPRVLGVTASRGPVELVAESWDAVDQRRGVIVGRQVQTHRLLPEGATVAEERAALDAILGLKADGFVWLVEGLGTPQGGTWRARTTDGLIVEVDHDSVTMVPLAKSPRVLPADRPAQVHHIGPTRTGPRQTGEPMPLEDLVAGITPEVRSEFEHAGLVQGVCAVRPVVPGHGEYTVWLPIAGGCATARAGAAAFTVLPARVGDPVRAARIGGGWVFEAEPRTVRVRALTRVQRPPQEPSDHLYLTTVDLHGEAYDLAQRPGEPSMALWLHDGRRRQHLAPMRAGARGHRIPRDVAVTITGPRRALRVQVDLADRAVHGSTTAAERHIVHRVAALEVVTDPKPEIGVIAGDPQASWWSVWRRFVVEPIVRRDRDDDHDRYGLEWSRFRSGDHHVHGALQDGLLRLDELRVPDSVAGWTNLVELDEEGAHVTSSRYSRNAIRALLRERDGRWRASCTEASALTLEQFTAELHRQGMATRAEPARLPVDLRYSGRFRDPGTGTFEYRFEWGYGWTCVIPEDRLDVVPGRDRGGVPGPLPLFFGEAVGRAGFPHRDGRLVMVVDAFSIEHGVARRLAQDARDRIVHRVAVEVALGAGTVRVRTVHGRRRSFAVGDTNDADALDVESAELDPAAVPDLVEQTRRDAVAGQSVVRRQLLAQLDLERFDGDAGRTLLFRPVHRLSRGQRVFMVASNVVDAENDQFLELRLPPELSDWSAAPVTRVPRRAFASREGLLRSLARRDPSALASAVMLIELRDTDSPRWTGQSTVALPRLTAHLRDYVRAHRGRSFAVLVRRHVNVELVELELEFRPGAYFRVPERDVRVVGEASDGSIVRLLLSRDGVLEIRSAVQGDRAYLPRTGRPAVVLPKQPLHRDRVDVAEAARRGMFTVAGLPGLQADAVSPAIDATALMSTSHPKAALVVLGAQVSLAIVHNTADQPVRLVVDEQRLTVSIKPMPGRPGGSLPVIWGRVSFADTGAWRLVERLREGGWHVHDQTTATWSRIKDGVARTSRRPLRNEMVTAARGPVFVHPELGLRYPVDQLRRYGFPASEVLDGSSDEVGDEPAEYVVAAPVADASGGLWVELSPGRVVELSAELLVAGPEDGFQPLSALDWGRFAAGDVVTLALHRPDGDDTQVACIAMHDWRHGPRAGFGGGRVLLPVKDVHQDSLRVELGQGRDLVDHPIAPGEVTRRARTIWLDGGNGIIDAQYEPALGLDDVVLLRHDRKFQGFGVWGAPGVTVTLAPAGAASWPGCEWLRALLADPEDRERLLRRLGGSMLMTVDRSDSEQVTLSRRLQPAGTLAPNRWWRAEVLGLLPDSRVLVAAGASLFAVAAGDLVAGLPAEAAPGVVRMLVERGPQWFHADETGSVQSGFPTPRRAGDDVSTRPFDVASAGGHVGVLCRDVDSAALRWLPSADAGWVKDLQRGELEELLRRTGDRALTCRVTESGSLSLAAARDGAHRFDALDIGRTLRVALGARRVKVDGRRLATVVGSDIVVECADLAELPISDDPVIVEVAVLQGRPNRQVVVVGQGRRRVRVDLPSAIIEALRESDDGAHASLVRSEAEERIVGVLRDGDRGTMPSALHGWLTSTGRSALGLDDACVDAGALVSAAMAAVDLAADEMESMAMLAAWLSWQAGARAARSMHVVPLVTDWLERDGSGEGEWQRLNGVGQALENEIDLPTLDRIYAFCRGMLTRARVRSDDGLTRVAVALSAAIGRPLTPPANVAAREAAEGPLAALGQLGRALAPPQGEGPPSGMLHRSQVELLEASMVDLARPLPLLPPARPLTVERQAAANELLGAAMKRLKAAKGTTQE